MALTDFTIIRKSLVHRWFSTAVTVAMVAVAVALLLLLLSMRDSGRQAFLRGTGNMHILVSRDSSPLTSVLNGVFYANAPQRPIRWDLYEQLAADGRLDYALPIAQGDNYRGFPTMAVGPRFFEKFQPVAGQSFALTTGAFPTGTYQVAIGSKAARATGLKVGDSLVITHGMGKRGAEAQSGEAGPGERAGRVHDDHPFTVSAILAPTGSAHDRAVFISLDSTWIVHADEFRRSQAKERGVPEADVIAPEPGNLSIDEKLVTAIYMRVKTRPGADGSASIGPVFDGLRRDVRLTVALPSREIEKLMEIVGSIDRIIIGIAAVVLLSSVISIMLAIYNSMDQRRRQVAILRVLGATPTKVAGLVMTESAIIGLAGACAGVGLALLGGTAVSRAMQQQLGLVIDLGTDAQTVFVIFFGTVFLAALAGVLPAVIAYRTDVLRQLRS